MALTCSDSLRSIAAIIDSIVRTVSALISFVCASACCASVCTAASTAERASSDFGLNSLFNRAANSLPSTVTPVKALLSICFSSMAGARRRLIGVCSGLVGRLRRLAEGLQQRGVLQDLRDQLFGAALAVHVGHEVGQLVARFEQLLQPLR